MDRVRAGYRVTKTSPGSGERGRRRRSERERERSREYLRLRLIDRDLERSTERECEREDPILIRFIRFIKNINIILHTKISLIIIFSIYLSFGKRVFSIIGLIKIVLLHL